MTQKHIRSGAGFGIVKRFYMGLLEPRVVTAVYGGVYSIVLLSGIASAILMPAQVDDSGGGYLLALLIAAFMTVGGGGGVFTVIRGDQWAERFALWATLVGVVAYLLTVAVAAAIIPGAQFMGVVGWAVTLAHLGLRFHWILDKPHRPGSRSDDMRKRRQRRRASSHHTED